MASAITLERILALQAAYIRCIDNDALESWPDFFLDACLYKVTTAENQQNGFEAGIIYADTKGMLIDRIAALRQANVYEKQSYRHILCLPNILKNGGNEAESEPRHSALAELRRDERRPAVMLLLILLIAALFFALGIMVGRWTTQPKPTQNISPTARP